MNRTVKNIIMIIIIILTGVAMYFTINMQSDNKMGTPPDMPSGQTPPAKPGENSNGDMVVPSFDNGNPPARPDETMEGNMTPPEKPDGNMGDISSSSNTITYILLGIESLIASTMIIYLIMSNFNKKTFKETYQDSNKLIISGLLILILTGGITYLTSTFINNSDSNRPSGIPGGNGGGNTSNVTYSSSKEITTSENITDGDFSSSTEDENAISVSGNVTSNLSNIKVTKTGDSDGGDNTSFYGTNSAIIAKDGAILNITDANITTNAKGANGVFSYGGSATTNNSNSDGTTINISNSTITTSKDNSGGIMTTGGGVMNAANLTITTAGTSSAAIRSDRGGGTVNVDGGTYKTTGKGSPTIYSTADITVKNATLIATASEGVVIEGKNSVTLENVELEDTNNTLNGQSTTYKNIFLYQSMSGDAANGKAVFTAKNSTITTNKGDSFYVTNTSAEINLENNKIINNDSTGYFLRIQKDSWGNSGNNGGTVTLNLTNQEVNGNISVDEISQLTLKLSSNSSFKGAINSSNTGEVNLILDSNSFITLTGDSYVKSITNDDSTNSNINLNGYKLYVNGTLLS